MSRAEQSFITMYPAMCRGASLTEMSFPAVPTTAATSNSKSSLRVNEGHGMVAPGPMMVRGLPL